MKNILFLLLAFSFSSPSFAKEAEAGVPADQSLRWLENGNKRYLTHKLRKDGQSAEDIKRLSTGQKPHAIVLSCSDSRVPPEVLFDQKLGEIFVVRTAGESLGDNVIGSIEYALEHLGSNLLVVMGHTSCGAVKAAFGSLDGSSVGSPALDALVKDIHPRISSFKGHSPSEHFENESWANAEGVARDLAKKSKIINSRLESGKLKIVPSLYDLDTGKVVFRETAPKVQVRAVASEAEPKAAATHEHTEAKAHTEEEHK